MKRKKDQWTPKPERVWVCAWRKDGSGSDGFLLPHCVGSTREEAWLRLSEVWFSTEWWSKSSESEREGWQKRMRRDGMRLYRCRIVPEPVDIRPVAPRKRRAKK